MKAIHSNGVMAGSPEPRRTPPHSEGDYAALARLYLHLLKASLRARMQYRLDFLTTTVFYAFLLVCDFIIVAAILYRLGSLSGWSIYEIGLLYGVSSLAQGLYRTLGEELNGFDRYLVEGNFDSVLIRPWPSLLVLLSRNIDLARAGAALQGVLVLAYSVFHLLRAARLSAAGFIYVCLLPLAGTAIFFAISLATAASGFWLTRTHDLMVFTMYAPSTASYYPLEIYPRALRSLLYSVLPVAFIAYVPVRYLLGKGGGPASLVTPPLVALLSLFLAYRMWMVGHKRYHSTGS